MQMTETPETTLLDLTTEIVAAFASNNKVEAEQLPGLILSVHQALSGTGQPAVEQTTVDKPSASQIRKSIKPEGLVSFEDGKTYKSLRRHLSAKGMTFAEYREKWGLPSDYPAVAPAYSARRSELAKAAGLGQKGRAARAAPAKAPAKRGRKPAQ
jgi:predicted transcriptional regulator